MADTAFQYQYRQEFVAAYEQGKSLLTDTVTTELSKVEGNKYAVFAVAGSGGAEAVTRGVNGLIPGRSDSLTQYTCTLEEWHDKPQRTNFNIFASQGDGRRLMQDSSVKVMNRKIDDLILAALANATNDTGASSTAAYQLLKKARVILQNNYVAWDGNISLVATPAFVENLKSAPQFASADYVNSKPMVDGRPAWEDNPGYYMFDGMKIITHPGLSGAGTSTEYCYLYHRSAMGFACPTQLLETIPGYNDEHDYSFCRTTGYMGAKLLQNSGVVQIKHDGSNYAAS